MLLKKLGNVRRKGQAMVEYALLVVCIAVVGAVAVSMLGEKTAETLSVAAAVLPGAHTDDNVPITVAPLVPTKLNADGAKGIDTQGLLVQDRYSALLGPDGAA